MLHAVTMTPEENGRCVKQSRRCSDSLTWKHLEVKPTRPVCAFYRGVWSLVSTCRRRSSISAWQDTNMTFQSGTDWHLSGSPAQEGSKTNPPWLLTPDLDLLQQSFLTGMRPLNNQSHIEISNQILGQVVIEEVLKTLWTARKEIQAGNNFLSRSGDPTNHRGSFRGAGLRAA